jgi:hypothetical protein
VTERIWTSGDRSSRGNAAVDADRLAGQPRGGRARQEQHHGREVAGLRDAKMGEPGRVREQLGAEGVRHDALLDIGIADQRGRQHVYADAVTLGFDGQRTWIPERTATRFETRGFRRQGEMTGVGNHIARLRRLEAAIAPASRWFIVRERDGDIEGQVQRARLFPQGRSDQAKLLCEGDSAEPCKSFKGPFHLRIDQHDRIGVTNAFGDSVARFPASDPTKVETFKTGYSGSGLGIDSQGNVWVRRRPPVRERAGPQARAGGRVAGRKRSGGPDLEYSGEQATAMRLPSFVG